MTQQWLKIDGMTCGSCERLIEREAGKQGAQVVKMDGGRGLALFDIPESKAAETGKFHEGGASAHHEREGPRHASGSEGSMPELTPLGHLVEALSAKGYPSHAISPAEAAEVEARVPKVFEEEAREFVSNFFGETPKFAIERNLFFQAVMLTTVLFGAILLLDMAWFKPFGFPQGRVPYLFYMVVAVVGNLAVLWHLRAYPRFTNHMDGMMIGMTAGMSTGLMVGAVIGATNGIFIGSVAGLLLGCAIGAYTGKCCGIMGVMEGLMAGIMGGTMGPMISVMMVLDHVELFMPLFIASVMTVLFGLTYMLILAPGRGPAKRPDWDFPSFSALCVSLVLLLTALMVWGPRGGGVI